METFPAMIKAEANHYLPFLLSTTFMMESVKAGAGREDAHAAIKEHAIATVRDLRNQKIKENDLPKRLAKDKRVGLKASVINSLIKNGQKNVGDAQSQVDYFVARAESWGNRYPDSKEYKVPSIL